MAYILEMASRAARKLADNLDEKKKVLSSDYTNIFAGLERDIDANVKGAQHHLFCGYGGGCCQENRASRPPVVGHGLTFEYDCSN